MNYAEEGPEGRGNPRKNQSLSSVDTEVLREAMRRLVPSNYVYGESGIGARAYELYGLCIGYAVSATRSSHLVAAICVMHATYERNSDLVIIPEDIEAAYKPMKIKLIRVSQIQKTYDLICERLKLPKLSVKSEKLFARIFRDCCDLPESDVLTFSQTGLRYEAEILSVLPPPKTDHLTPGKDGKIKVSSRTVFRQTTIVSLAAVYALRFHNFVDVTATTVQKQVHVSQAAFHSLGRRFKQLTAGREPENQETSAMVPVQLDEFGIPISSKKRRYKLKSSPVRIGNDVVPSGYLLRPKDRVIELKREQVKEEVVRIAAAPDPASWADSSDTDHLALLYLDDLPPLGEEPAAFPIALPEQPVGRVPRKKKAESAENRPALSPSPPADNDLDFLFAN